MQDSTVSPMPSISGVSSASGDATEKLPGLVRLFRAQLWLGMLIGVVGAGGVMWVLLLSSRAVGPLWLMLSAFVLFLAGGSLCFWADSALGARSPEAPGRCRVLVGLNIGLSALALAGIWLGKLAGILDVYVQQLLLVTWPLLIGMIWSEAWRRYFAVSPRVWATFRPDRNPGYWPATAPDPDTVVPGEIGVFLVVCWSAFVSYGLDPAVFLFVNYGSLVVKFQNSLFAGSILAGLTLPLIAAFAVKERGERLLFWCLGLWLGFFVFFYVAWVAYAGLDLLTGMAPRRAVPLPSILDPQILLGLVFWWYFATSERAKAWFRAERNDAAL